MLGSQGILANLDEVLITDELAKRPARPPDHATEAQALSELARELAVSPGTVLQRLVDWLIEMNLAGSAGISILRSEDEASHFHWEAVAGLWAQHLGGIMPFDASPCSVVITRNTHLLFSRPHAHSPAASIQPLIHEILLVPFHVRNEPVGTLWAIAHDPERAFDSEDLRLLTQLAQFASAAYQTVAALHEVQAAKQELEQRVAERTNALTQANAALRESEETLAVDLANAGLLRDLSERLVTEENASTIYDEIVSAAMAVARADAGTIQIYDPRTKALELLATKNFTRTITDHFHFVDASSRTACGIALNTGQRAFVDFPDEVADFGCQLLVGEGFQSALALPLISRTGAPVGMLNTHWRETRYRPPEKQLHFLDLLARQAADLIEQRQAQRDLRASEERLRQFGEASSDVLWMRDAETLQWVYLTPAFEEIYGLGREAALQGDNLTGWLDMVVPEERQRVLDTIQRVRAGERACFEYRIRRARDGAVRWLRDTGFPLHDPAGQVRCVGGVGRDITEEKVAVERQGVLVKELQHRSRNLLGVVTSLANRTVGQGAPVESFTTRLQALSRAQALLSQSGSDTVEVGDLVGAELAAHADGALTRITTAGPKVLLTSRQVQNFALALHELTTNAVKYGALRGDTGQLSITWERTRNEGTGEYLALSWIESGVDVRPEKVTRHGNGRELIEQALAYALQARTEYELGRDGVRCRIEMPVS